MPGLTVGYSHDSYLEKRNFIDLPYSNVNFQKVYDYYKIKSFLFFKLFNKVNPDSQYSFYRPAFTNGTDLMHFFSSISMSNQPWVVTSSVPLPRWTRNVEKGIQRLAHESCRKIIFLSEICRQRQFDLLKKYPSYAEQIRSKCTVLHPAQRPLIGSIDEKHLDDQFIYFTVVGHQIMIKGGYEILQVFEKLHREGYPVRLNIVSLLHEIEYLKDYIPASRIEQIRNKISLKPEFLRYYPSLPNNEVINLLKKSHVALLPSYGDTYGYSVLESQACGCPVISTDIIALPEINNDECGWMIEVPKLEFGRPDIYSTEKYEVFSRTIEDNLYRIVKSIAENPSVIRKKGYAALEKINRENAPSDRAFYLENLYNSIVSKK